VYDCSADRFVEVRESEDRLSHEQVSIINARTTSQRDTRRDTQHDTTRQADAQRSRYTNRSGLADPAPDHITESRTPTANLGGRPNASNKSDGNVMISEINPSSIRRAQVKQARFASQSS
jgi:hypothetical protein